MKKLLSILATITLTVTPVTSVVACGSSKEKNNEDSRGLNILKGGNIGVLTADDLINSADNKVLFGNEDNSVHDFMNYFAFQISQELSNSSSKLYKEFIESTNNNPYINDNFINNIKKQYDNSRQYATNQWDEAVNTAKDKGKKWEEEFRKDLEKQLNRTFKSYLDAKDVYITNQMMKGTNGTSVIDSLLNAIYAIPQDNKVLTFDEVLRDLIGQIMGYSGTIEGIKIDLSHSWGAGRNQNLNLIGELTKLLQALGKEAGKEKTPNIDYFSIYLINFINATGGQEPKSESQVKLSDINWMTKTTFKANVLSDPAKWAQEIVKRACSTYEKDYNGSEPTVAYNPIIDGSGKGVKPYQEINSYISLSDSNTLSSNASTKGLFSNAQRYFANQYFQTKKPLAISEFVIAPLTSNGKLSENINNAAYIDKTETNKADVNSLNNFMGIFINKANWNGVGSDDYTKSMVANSSDYSWDQLMNSNGNVSSWTKQGTDRFTWSKDFDNKITLKQHNKLLTWDADSADYSDLLKYSIYDYLAKGSGEEYKSNSNPYDKDEDGSVTGNTGGKLTNEQNNITNWINSMNRRISADGKTTNVYQVLNNQQGIISFMESDGIHLVRIEGYELLKAEKNAQSTLSTNSFLDSSTEANKVAINNYQAIESISRNLNSVESDAIKNAIKNQTYDFKSADQSSYFNYQNLNTTFGNKYLQFLANSSILYAIGIEGTKEKYDLGKEVQTYLSTSIPSDSSKSGTNLWIGAWTYFKELLKLDDQKFFDLVFPSTEQTMQTLMIDNYAAKNTIYQKYRDYIISNISTVKSEVTSSTLKALTTNWNTWADSKNNIESGDLTNQYKPLNTLDFNKDILGKDYWVFEAKGKGQTN